MKCLEKLKKSERFRFYLLSFSLPFLISLVLFAIYGIYPFGSITFLRKDMYHQYLPFMTEFYHKIKSGDSLYYSWNAGLGANFTALYVYYLASPLNWLVILFPESHILEFMSYLVLIKTGFMGVTFSYYLRQHFRSCEKIICVFGCLYAMSGFMAAYSWNVMWMDCVLLAPLIIAGLEKIVKEGQSNLYCISLALSIISNYYISIMICIFLVLYFVVLLIQHAKGFIHIIKSAARFAFYSVVAGGMAAFLLVPEIMALMSTSFSKIDFPNSIEFYMNIFTILTRQLVAVQTETGLGHQSNSYCGIVILILIPVYLMCGKIRLRERISMAALTAFIVLSYNMNILNFIWHGFNYPDSLPARQSFLHVMLMLTMSYEAVGHIRDMKKWQIITAAAVGAAVVALCAIFNHADEETGIETWIISGIFIVCYIIAMFAYYAGEKYYSSFIGMLICTAVLLEAGINMYVTSPRDLSREGYYKHKESYTYLSEKAKKTDVLNQGEFVRIEELNKNIRNDSMIEGFSSSSYFSSTMNSKIKDFFEKYGMEQSRVFYMSNGLTPFTASVIGSDYYISTKEIESVSSDSVMTYVDQKNGDYLYKNTYALPFGFVIPHDTTDADTGSDKIDNQNILSKKLGGKDIYHKINATNTEGSTVITVPYSGHVYAYPASNKAKEITLSSNDIKEAEKFDDMKYNHIMDLGWHEKGTVLTLTADEEGKEVNMCISAYILDEKEMKNTLDGLKADKFVLMDFSSAKVDAIVSMRANEDLVLQVPDEAGWTVRIDGARIKTEDFEGLFIRVPVSAGMHQVSLTFIPEGIREGAVISIVSLCVYIAVSLMARRLLIQRQMKEQEQLQQLQKSESDT